MAVSYHPCFSADPRFGSRDPGGRYHFLRILYRPWMGILRGTVCRVFFRQKGLIPYRVLYIAVAAIAPVISLNLVWTVADILNALMAIPNLIAVLLLSNVIIKETQKYINDLDARDDTPVEVIDK